MNQNKDLERVCELIGSIFYYGKFHAETPNEVELEALLRKLGYFFESEEQLMQKLHPVIPVKLDDLCKETKNENKQKENV